MNHWKIINNNGIKFHCETQIELDRARTLFTKEPGTIKWLRENVKPGSVFYDVGANIGCYTLFAASLGATVVAFEPHVGNAHRLIRNVALNGFADRVQVLTCAVAHLSGFTAFNYLSLVSGSSGSQAGHNTAENGETFTPLVTEMKWATTLDALPRTVGPDLLKIDVDGNEVNILHGAVDTILSSVRSLQVEIRPGDKVVETLAGLGFHLQHTHYTANGTRAIESGAVPSQITRNGVFTRV